MRGKQTPDEKKAAVLAESIKDPENASTRKVGEKTGLPHTTVQDIQKEGFRTVRTKSVSEIMENDLEIVRLTTAEQKRRVKNEAQNLKMDELTRVADVSMKRNQLMSGEATERTEVKGKLSLKELDNMSIEELTEEIMKREQKQ